MGIKDLFRKNNSIEKDLLAAIHLINLELYERLVEQNMFDLFFNKSLSSIEFTGNGFRLVFFVKESNRITKEMNLSSYPSFKVLKQYYYSLSSNDLSNINDDINIKKFITSIVFELIEDFYKRYNLPNVDKLKKFYSLDYVKIRNELLDNL